MLRIAIIGYGYWGPNLLRNFISLSNCKVSCVIDLRQQRLNIVNKFFPEVKTTTNMDEAFASPEVDAIVIATPVFTHYPLAKKALELGKHVLIEKPLASSVAQAEELINIAQKKGLILMVDHTFLYTGAVNKIKSLIDRGDMGNIQYFDSTRINLGLFQPDINVLWDLAPHDISILNFLVNDKPCSVNAIGVSHTNNGIENIAYLTVNYSSNFIAHFHCSWSSPVKMRILLIGGDKKMLKFDDIEPTEKIKIYDTRYDYKTDEDKKRLSVDYRTGDIYLPKVELKEALAGVSLDFVNSVLNNTTPISNSQSGLDVVKILEASDTSIKNRGKEILL